MFILHSDSRELMVGVCAEWGAGYLSVRVACKGGSKYLESMDNKCGE